MKEIARILSLYFYTFISVILFVILFSVKLPSKITIPVSKTYEKWDTNSDPIWVAHITDLHLNDIYPIENNRTIHLVKYISKVLKPTYTLFGGDLVDNCLGKKMPLEVRQKINDWHQYHKMINESGLDKDSYVEVIGNHDLFGVLDVTDSTPAFEYTNVKKSDFNVFSRNKSGINVISWNPANPPFGPAVVGYVRTVKGNMLDLLEEELKKVDQNASATFVLSHFNSPLVLSLGKSKTKLNHHEIMEKYNVTAFLVGHSHPKQIETKHYRPNLLEITSSASLDFGVFTLILVDQKHLSIHRVDGSIPEPAFVTFPTPSQYENNIPKEGNYQIRVLSFSNSTTKNFTVSGDFNCTLKYTRDVKNAKLYSCDINFTKGDHTIFIRGDLETEIHFTIGKDFGPFKEKVSTDFVVNAFLVAFLICAIKEFMVLYGLITPMSINTLFFHAEKWLKDHEEGNYYWAVCIGLGPVLTGYRLKHLPIWVQIMIGIFIIWTFCLPYSFFYVERKISFVWLYGIVANNKFNFDIFCIMFAILYLYGPMNIIEAAFSMLYDPIHLPIIFNLLILIAFYIVAIWFWILYGSTFDFILRFFSFPFTIIPLIAIIVHIVLRLHIMNILFQDVEFLEGHNLINDSDDETSELTI